MKDEPREYNESVEIFVSMQSLDSMIEKIKLQNLINLVSARADIRNPLIFRQSD
ncbi:MAG TPA: hypothetical protein VFY68_08435 [Nitrososphaeraceae archaeon]|nr:hypothetical protein [Nitrososphaeraceae archaeon]